MIRVQGYVQDYDVVHRNGDLSTYECHYGTWHVLPPTWILNLFQYSEIQFDFKSNLTSAISNFRESQYLASFLLPIMPWPMTLAPMNEAIRRKNCVKKNLDMEKNNRHDLGGH